jgi:glycosyltransferase involved in cell wall biosynthesis
MIRVLQVLAHMTRGGAESFVMNIYREIDTDQIQFDFVDLGNGPTPFDEEIYKRGGTIYHLPLFRLYNLAACAKAWNSFFSLHAKEYDFVHCQYETNAWICFKYAKKYGLTTVVHSHNSRLGKFPKNIYKKIMYIKMRPFCDYFMACGREAAICRFGKKIATKQTYIINNGIDPNKFLFNNSDRDLYRKQFGISESALLIGETARFNYQKNHVFSIKVFAKVVKRFPDSKLVFIGDGKLLPKIKRMVRKRHLTQSVIFLGGRNDANRILNAFDLFLMPSLFEGYPIALIEAQCNGLPALISNRVPQEGILRSDLVKSLSLKKSASVWASAICPHERIAPSSQFLKKVDAIETAQQYLKCAKLICQGKPIV